jgi:hypothetical protein
VAVAVAMMMVLVLLLVVERLAVPMMSSMLNSLKLNSNF